MATPLRFKTVSPVQAVIAIKGGNRVLLEGSLAEPTSLIEALIWQRDRFKNVEIITASPIHAQKLAGKTMAAHFRLKTFFARGGIGKSIQKGEADYLPLSLWGLGKAIKERILPIDVALIHLSPPDNRGNCSFGINVSYAKPAAEAARVVIAELNDRMPRSIGDASIPITEIDWICESSRPLPVLEPSNFSKEEKKIAEAVAELIPAGATIEVGIGGIPNAILQGLRKKEDLGFHSGMISDTVMELIMDGIINNRKKQIDPGKSVASMAMGSERLYRWIHENPSVSFHPSTYTHSMAVISQIDQFVAINSGLQVDLTGQVNGETVDGVLVSGIGGGIDFARGACASRGGLSIIALPSTTDSGKISRILPSLPEGTPVTYHRSDVDFIVTEYGIADLRCRSLEERSNRLIQIAHPEFREGLRRGSARL